MFSLFCVQVEAVHKMENSYFGEGLTLLGDRFLLEILVGEYFVLSISLDENH